MLALAFMLVVITAQSRQSFALTKPVKAISSFAVPSSTSKPPNMSHDLFRFDSASAVAPWMATDDRVMGGVSQSLMRFDGAGHAVFEGMMSLDNNGGFASVRARVKPTPITLPAEYVLTVRGDGKRYKLNLRTEGQFDAVSYQASFDTEVDTWMTVRIPVSAFRPSFRGRQVNAPPLDPSKVAETGLMIAEKQAGRFQLHLQSIVVATP